jgi:hypothetical protein
LHTAAATELLIAWFVSFIAAMYWRQRSCRIAKYGSPCSFLRNELKRTESGPKA